LADINGQKGQKQLKEALKDLKEKIKEFSLNEGVMLGALFSCHQMK